MEHHTVTVDGLEYVYSRTGDKTKPAFLLLHGLTDNALMWTPVARRLQNDFEIYLLDFHGHGRSQRVDLARGHSSTPADILSSVTAALGLEKFGVMGHSMGASFACQLAATHPERINFVILEDPPWQLATEQSTRRSPNQFRDWILGLQEKTHEGVVEYGSSHHPLWLEEDYPLWATAKLQFDPNFLKLMRPPSVPWEEQIKLITAPALLIYGEQDKGSLVSEAAADLVRATWGANHVIQIPNTTHHVQRDQHEAFMQAVNAFLP
ncbi:MAG: alpha/beta hydrolase [Chloroflexota bacterium]